MHCHTATLTLTCVVASDPGPAQAGPYRGYAAQGARGVPTAQYARHEAAQAWCDLKPPITHWDSRDEHTRTDPGEPKLHTWALQVVCS